MSNPKETEASKQQTSQPNPQHPLQHSFAQPQTQQLPYGYPIQTGLPLQNYSQPSIVGLSPTKKYDNIIGESKIEYVPYERTYTEYQAVQRTEQVPIEKTITEYQAVQTVQYVPVERVVTEYQTVQKTEYVPVEKKVQEYYTIEHQMEYIPQVYQEKYTEYIPVEKYQERVEYVPIERQIVHQPVEEIAESRPPQYSSFVQTLPPQTILQEPVLTQSQIQVQQPIIYQQPVQYSSIYQPQQQYISRGPNFAPMMPTQFVHQAPVYPTTIQNPLSGPVIPGVLPGQILPGQTIPPNLVPGAVPFGNQNKPSSENPNKNNDPSNKEQTQKKLIEKLFD